LEATKEYKEILEKTAKQRPNSYGGHLISGHWSDSTRGQFVVIINEDDIMHLLSAISQYSVEAAYSGADSLAVSWGDLGLEPETGGSSSGPLAMNYYCTSPTMSYDLPNPHECSTLLEKFGGFPGDTYEAIWECREPNFIMIRVFRR
jgi:hypothetical protein